MLSLNSFRSLPRGARSRRGFSLLEIMLVLAIMVLFASLAAPTVFQLIRGQNLSRSGDLVRAEMGRARVRAIRTGQIHAFYFVTNESWFSVGPFSQVTDMAQRARQVIAQTENRTNELSEELLPVGIRFEEDNTTLEARAQQVLSVSGNSGTVKPILFYPDGSSQSSQIRLVDDRGNRVLVELRGLTGTASQRRIGRDEQ